MGLDYAEISSPQVARQPMALAIRGAFSVAAFAILPGDARGVAERARRTMLACDDDDIMHAKGVCRRDARSRGTFSAKMMMKRLD